MSKYNPATKEKIRAAAEKEFHENGFKGARTVKIAERAGVSRTMLHYYFRTKEDLFQEVLQHSFGFFLQHAQQHVVETPNLRSFIDNLIELLSDILLEKPGLACFVVNILNENLEVITSLPFIQDENIPGILNQLLDQARDRQEIQSKISGEDLVLNIYGLVTIPFLVSPLIAFKEKRSTEEMQSFLQQRKEMIKTFIWNGLDPVL
ncbi:MAG: TetR/AcrR family transcriptional regulator [Bacteroidota bacterium]